MQERSDRLKEGKRSCAAISGTAFAQCVDVVQTVKARRCLPLCSQPAGLAVASACAMFAGLGLAGTSA